MLRPHGLEHPLTIGAVTDDSLTVEGPTRSLAAWLAGRADGADLTVSPAGELPAVRNGSDDGIHRRRQPRLAPAVRELRGLTVTKVSVGPYDNNAYLLRCAADGTQVLIDAATTRDPAEADRRRRPGGRGDDPLASRPPLRTRRSRRGDRRPLDAGADDAAEIPVVTETVRDGDTIAVGDCTLEVIHIVGHTPGSIVLLYREPDGIAHLFTGDSLFPGGVGKTVGEENFTSLIGDVEAKLFGRLPDDTWFYPGHGKDSTLGAERLPMARPRVVSPGPVSPGRNVWGQRVRT